MKKLIIQGKEYIEFSLNIPVLLNTAHYESFKESFERYKVVNEFNGYKYEGTIEDFANLCAVSVMNINLPMYAEIISR